MKEAMQSGSSTWMIDPDRMNWPCMGYPENMEYILRYLTKVTCGQRSLTMSYVVMKRSSHFVA